MKARDLRYCRVLGPFACITLCVGVHCVFVCVCETREGQRYNRRVAVWEYELLLLYTLRFVSCRVVDGSPDCFGVVCAISLAGFWRRVGWEVTFFDFTRETLLITFLYLA